MAFSPQTDSHQNTVARNHSFHRMDFFMSLFFNAEDGFYTLYYRRYHRIHCACGYFTCSLPLLFQAAYPRKKKEALFDQAARILSSNAGARLCDILCGKLIKNRRWGGSVTLFCHALYNPYRLLVWS